MKRILLFVLSLCMLFSLAACGGMGSSEPTMTDEELYNQLSEALKEQPIYAFDPNYIAQRKGPDIMTASVKNTSGKTIAKIYLAFAAWDEEGKPVFLLNQDQKAGDVGKYTDLVYTDPTMLTDGDTWVGDKGYGLSKDCNIQTFRVIAKSYETADGSTWENPQYRTWSDVFVGKELKPYMTKDEAGQKPDPREAYEEMVSAVATQPIFADSPVYLTQPLEDDLLIAKFYNKSAVTIKKFYLAFAAFDKDGKSVAMTGASGKEYVMVANYIDGISVAPGEVFEKKVGLPIEDNADIVYIKVLAAAYEDEAGNFWKNPRYSDWKYFLEEVTLEEYQLSEADRAQRK